MQEKEIYQFTCQHVLSKVVTLAAEIELDKKLPKEGISIQAIATLLGYSEKAFLRYARILSSFEIATIKNNMIFPGRLTAALKSIRTFHFMNGAKIIKNLESSLKSNSSSFKSSFGKEFNQLLEDEPKINNDMIAWQNDTFYPWFLASALTTHDFKQYENITELGSGGNFLAYCLKKGWISTGTLISSAIKVNAAKLEYTELANSNKLNFIFGNILEIDPLPQSDLFIFPRVLISFNDNTIITILDKLHAASAKVLILDYFMPDEGHPDYQLSILADMNILSCLGGEIRTESQWQSIISQSSFQLAKISVNLNSTNSILPTIAIELTRR